MGEVFARRYELLDPIAEGGMGAVWRVRDQQDGGVKAAKLLRHSDAGTLLRFMREQATRIHHPHVVTPLSWVGEDDTVLFTMPLVRGGSVANLVGDWGALPPIWVATIVDQALSALEAVHTNGVVHRDVKPANLLLEPTGRERPHVRLSDFGIATSLDQPRLTSGASAVGTPGYMAPEQRTGADPDPRQDLYALATVGLEMLVGQAPPFPDDLHPTALVGLLVEARNPDPTRRPASATAFRAALADAVPDLAAGTWDPAGVEVLDQYATHEAPPAPAISTRPTIVLEPAPPVPAAPPPPAPTAPTASSSEAPSMRAIIALGTTGIVLIVVAVLLLLLG